MQNSEAAHSPDGHGNATTNFFCAATGVYASTFPPVPLPAEPSLSLVPHLFARLPRTRPRAPALVDAATSETVSRADLCRLVSSLAGGLSRRLGLHAGDIVLLVLPNSIVFSVAFLAVLLAGGVATTLSPSSTPAEIAARVRETNPTVVLSAPENAGKIWQLGVPVVLVPESFDLRDDGVLEFAPFRALLESGAATPPAVGQDDAAAILYSSGTGGRSKGVVLTHRNLIATTELFVCFEASQYTQPACDNVYLAALPMFHVYGLSLFTMGLLSLGSTVVVMKRFDVAEAIKAINRYKVTHFPLVPPIMAALVAAAKPTALPVDSLVQVSSGAAPLSGKLIQDFVKTFPHIDFIQVVSCI
jgi:4-coumarate--CoA ligase